jgi:hypothetical protein
MGLVRPQILPLILIVAKICAVGIKAAIAQDQTSLDFEHCKSVADDRARLACLKKLLPQAGATTATEGLADWRLIRTPRPNGGPDVVALMRTADTSQSDPDLAGLMVRCQEEPRREVLLALVRPFPPRSKRDVVVSLGTAKSILHGETSPEGTALILPIDATAFTTGAYRELKQFSIKINDPEGDIRGVIRLDGIGPAVAKLSASCPQG